MTSLASAGTLTNAIVFLIAAAAIVWTGIKLASVADRLADRLGWGEAITGTMLLGLTTALPGLAASITAALEGRPALAISNAVGGIAIQTTFLAVADIAHPKANLEHAAASLANMIQTVVLAVLIAFVLLGLSGPEVAVAHVHPVTFLLFAIAGAGFWLVYRSQSEPMWRPRVTSQTVEDVPEEKNLRENAPRLFAGFALNAVIVTAAGAVVAHTAGNIADQNNISQTVAGALLTGIATSLPELVTTVAAVRRGALTLAVSDIVGGNFFDVLFVFAADIVFVGGSIYHADGVGMREMFLCSLAICLNLVFLLGLLYRQRAGPANIGFESVALLVLYVAGMATMTYIE